MSGKKEIFNKLKIIFSLIFTLFFFSLFEIISKRIDLDSVALTGLRFFLGGLIIFILNLTAILKELKLLDNLLKIKVILTGFLNVCIAMLSLQFAVKTGNATTSAIIISSNPVFVYIINTIIENIDNRVKNNNFIAINLIRLTLLLFGVAGIFLIIYKKDVGDNLISISLAILASISFATYTILTKKLLNKVSALTLNSLSFISNGLLLLFISLLLFKSSIFVFFNFINIEKIIFLSILSFGTTGFAYITYFYALKNLDAVKVSLVFYLKPIIVLSLNYIFLFESIGINKLIGILIIIFS
ncbi:MAG: DMT family transporter, partial [Exilispira sp.]